MMEGTCQLPSWSDEHLLAFANGEQAILGNLERDPSAFEHHPGKAAVKHLRRYMDGERDEAMKHAFRAMECHYRSEAYLDDLKLADGDCEEKTSALIWARRIKMDTAYGYSQLAGKVAFDLAERRIKLETDTVDDLRKRMWS